MPSNKRHDGRRASELRPVKITTNFVRTADGSCLIEMGGTPGGNTPAEFAAFVDRERESWKKIVDAANLTME